MKKITIKCCEWDPKKCHPYDVKTTGKHPIHMIEGGTYITFDMTHNFDGCSDMGCFYVNQKDYQYLCDNMKDVVFEETESGLREA